MRFIVDFEFYSFYYSFYVLLHQTINKRISNSQIGYDACCDVSCSPVKHPEFSHMNLRSLHLYYLFVFVCFNFILQIVETRNLLTFILRGASHIDFYYEKRHCDIWGLGGWGGGGVGVMTFLKIDNYSKSYIKNNKPLNIAQVLILNLSIIFNKKNTLSLFLYHSGNCQTITANVA